VKKILLVGILNIFCFSLSFGESIKPQEGPWIRIYDRPVRNVYIKATEANTKEKIPLENIYVAIKAKDRISGLLNGDISLVNYKTGEESSVGCAYDLTRENITDIKYSKTLKESAGEIKDCTNTQQFKKFNELYKKCRNLQKANEDKYCHFFVTLDHSYSQCLLLGSRYISEMSRYRWESDAPQNNMKFINELRVALEKKNVASEDSKWPVYETKNIRNYLKSEGNKLFGGYSYGIPVSLFQELVPKKFHLDKNSLFLSIKKERNAIWQKHYLIKTDGFLYIWGNRIIDEPQYVSRSLNDGTILLEGLRSVLRINYKNGSTQAPKSIVRVKTPQEIRKKLKEYGVETCYEVSTVGCDMKNMPKNSYDLPEPEYYKAVIESVDEVIQKVFEEGDK